MKKYPHQKTAK